MDDLEILELIFISGILTNYDAYLHVLSDVPTRGQFLPGGLTQTQAHLDQLVTWKVENKMLLNPEKSSYTIFSRSKEEFVTRLTVNGSKMTKNQQLKF